MRFLYSSAIYAYYLLIKVSQYFNPKAQLWLAGRKDIFTKISREVDSNIPSIWFHFASLGEFEQGRPVLDRIKELYPGHQLIITFFSPSGYELRKNYSKASHIFYLPLDTKNNAKRFVEIVRPTLAIFTKYEFWYHYFNELYQKKCPLIIISAIFRPSQPYFKWYGSFNRKILKCANYFFVQDETSKLLLQSIDIADVMISGDTRFDRVIENSRNIVPFEDISKFCGSANVFVAGSTWPVDEKHLIELVKNYPRWKFIIAPHEIKEEKIDDLTDSLNAISECVRYSNIAANTDAAQVLIIDNIGMLSSLYQYADVAYIGGGFGVGIHNTLEAAVFGIPVIFGPNFKRFREARALVENGAAFPVANTDDLLEVMNQLEDEAFRISAGDKAESYVMREKGATELILNYIQKIIPPQLTEKA